MKITLWYRHVCGTACDVNGLDVPVSVKAKKLGQYYKEPFVKCLFTDQILQPQGRRNPL